MSASGERSGKDWRVYFTPSLFMILLLGFASGLPLALTGATLARRLSEAHLSAQAIGTLAAAGTPYALKFLWAPLLDHFRPPFFLELLGKRKGWIVFFQTLLIGALAILACLEPSAPFSLILLVAWCTAFCSASQDILIDAYRVERMAQEGTQAEGAAMTQLGYRLGMIMSGAGAFWLADQVSWRATYLAQGGILGLCLLFTLLAKEPQGQPYPPRPGFSRPGFALWLQNAFLEPFLDFARTPHYKTILAFIVTYKLADAFMGILTNPFYYQIGFSKTQLAEIVKFYGIIATLAGGFFGSALVRRFGLYQVLILAGLLHGLTNLLFVAQARMGANIPLLAISVTLENISGGVGLAAFVAYLSGLCRLRYTATQYALLSALAALARTLLATPAGFVQAWLGWEGFFLFASSLALPGVWLACRLASRDMTQRSFP
jgi:PAT family beta-lactamase induction signal transducer AmpG